MPAVTPPNTTAPAPGESAIAQRATDTVLRDALRTTRWGHQAKKFAWRLTGCALWASIVASWLGLEGPFYRVVSAISDALRSAVAAADLIPPNTRYLRHVLRWGWWLVITNFRVTELVGLAFYCLAFPFTFLLYLIFRKFLSSYLRDRSAVAKQKGLIALRPGSHYRALITTALLAWFLLYGDSGVIIQVELGAALAALLFLALAFRALLGARPAAEDDAAIFPRIERVFYSFADALLKRAREKPANTKLEVWFLRSIHEPARNLCRRITLFIRGRRGRLRVSAIVMADYVLSLITLGIAAISFWTLALRAALAPVASDYSALLRYTMAHFFSGVSIPQRNATLPLWLDIGPSVTSWVLFVLFIGPTASLLPLRQQAFAARVELSYKRLRAVTLVISKYLRENERRAKALPTVE